MQDKSTYLLAADSEAEMEDWINTLNKILHSSFEIAMQEKRNGDIHDGVCVCVRGVLSFWVGQNDVFHSPEETSMSHKNILCRQKYFFYVVTLEKLCK